MRINGIQYSLDLRQQVTERVNQGHSVEETAELFQVSPATIYRWRDRPSLERTVVTQRRRKLPPEPLRRPVQDLSRGPSLTGLSPLMSTPMTSVMPSNAIASPSKKSFATVSATIGNGKSS